MKIALGSDHAGFKLKEKVKSYCLKIKLEFKDFGCFSEGSCDYPDFGFPAASAVAKAYFDKGILICGTGIGMSIVANRFRGNRAALCLNRAMAKLSRKHNDANILCLGARIVNQTEALEIIDVFLKTRFEKGRHLRRIKKVDSLRRL